jgi:homoserine O-acetyltransferase/O-succinyltransferase
MGRVRWRVPFPSRGNIMSRWSRYMSHPNGHHGKRRAEAGSVGIVQRQYARFDVTLPLRSGSTLDGFTLAYETYGTLNAERSNAILICHALSGDSHVAGYYTDDPNEKPGWWDEAVGPGKMFDTNRFFVICPNVIGGCQGSTGPSSPASDGKPYALRFPIITVADMVRAQTHLLDHLGIESLFAVAGGSMGGMQALQWGVDYPDRVRNILFIAATPKSSTQNIAFNEIGRQAIYADPNWNGGDYYEGTPPSAGLAVARMVGHITYMSEHSLDSKFGRDFHGHEGYGFTFETDFEVESYFRYQGAKFVQRFDANSYLYITKALDYFDIADGYSSMAAALEHLKAKVLVVSFSSDWLYTAEQALDLVTALEQGGKDVEYHLIQASFGHDSFLVEVELMTRLLGGFLDKRWQKEQSQIAVQ